MKLLIKKVEGLKLPEQANPNEDAGYDVFATSEPNIVGEFITRPLDDLKVYKSIKYIEYRTNLFVCPITQETKRVVNAHGDASGALCGLIYEPKFKDFHLELFPRSSISKYNLTLANSVGTIDTGYRNEILVRFKYLMQPEDMLVLPEQGIQKVYCNVNKDAIYKYGDKIIQIKPRANINIEFVLVDKLPDSSRKMGGFGSSDAK